MTRATSYLKSSLSWLMVGSKQTGCYLISKGNLTLGAMTEVTPQETGCQVVLITILEAGRSVLVGTAMENG